MRHNLWMLGLLMILLGSGWITGAWAQSPTSSDLLTEARTASQELLHTLKTHLLQELQTQGIVGAIEVCSSLGQKIPQELSAKYGLTLKRTSLKYRNPHNAPTPDEEALLKKLEDLAQKDSVPEEWVDTVVIQGVPTFRYAKPLFVQGLCLTCHGPEENLAPAVREILDERYPHDRARGYQVGDFRGIVVVKAPLQKQGGQP